MENIERSSKNFSKDFTNQEKVVQVSRKRKAQKKKIKKEEHECPENC